MNRLVGGNQETTHECNRVRQNTEIKALYRNKNTLYDASIVK